MIKTLKEPQGENYFHLCDLHFAQNNTKANLNGGSKSKHCGWLEVDVNSCVRNKQQNQRQQQNDDADDHISDFLQTAKNTP